MTNRERSQVVARQIAPCDLSMGHGICIKCEDVGVCENISVIATALDEAERRGLERGSQPLEALTLRELLDLSRRTNAAVSRRILAGTAP